MERGSELSSPGESHPEALPELYVSSLLNSRTDAGRNANNKDPRQPQLASPAHSRLSVNRNAIALLRMHDWLHAVSRRNHSETHTRAMTWVMRMTGSNCP
jgi:hypothetical protein